MKKPIASFVFLISILVLGLQTSIAHYALPTEPPSFADQIVRYLFENGRKLSPSYKAADCSTLMTRTMERFFILSLADRRQINISFASELEKKGFLAVFQAHI